MMGPWGDQRGYEYGRGYDRLTEDQRNQLDKLHRGFYDETAQLRKQLSDKSGELNTIFKSSNPDVAKARALQKEITGLRSQLAEKRLDFELEERKIAPDARYGHGYGRGSGKGYGKGYGRGYGRGYGHHMGGYGHHMGGYGPQSGGYGQGGCWQ